MFLLLLLLSLSGIFSDSLWFTTEPVDTYVQPKLDAILFCDGRSKFGVVHYRWFKKKVTSYRPFSYKQNLTVNYKNRGYYFCSITDNFGSLLSRQAHVKIEALQYSPPSYVIYKTSPGNPIFMTSPHVDGDPSITSYVWRRFYDQTSNLVDQVFYTLNQSLFIPHASAYGSFQLYKVFAAWKENRYLLRSYEVSINSNQIAGPCDRKTVSYFNLPRDTHIFLGDTLQLEVLGAFPNCRELLTQAWFHNGRQVSINRTVQIYNISLLHAGMYESHVFVGMQVMSIQKVRVYIYERPSLQFRSKALLVKRSNTYVYIDSPPIRNINNIAVSARWIIDGEPLMKNNQIKMFTNGTLLIPNANPTHSGYYQVIYTYNGFPSTIGDTSKGGILKDVVSLQIESPMPGCGGKIISTDGQISFFVNRSNYQSKLEIICSWYIQIPLPQQTIVHFVKFPLPSVDNGSNILYNGRDMNCEDTKVSINSGTRWRQRNFLSYCVTNPPPKNWIVNHTELFIHATIHPMPWKHNGLLLRFYPKTKEIPLSSSQSAEMSIVDSTSNVLKSTASTSQLLITSIISCTISNIYKATTSVEVDETENVKITFAPTSLQKFSSLKLMHSTFNVLYSSSYSHFKSLEVVKGSTILHFSTIDIHPTNSISYVSAIQSSFESKLKSHTSTTPHLISSSKIKKSTTILIQSSQFVYKLTSKPIQDSTQSISVTTQTKRLIPLSTSIIDLTVFTPEPKTTKKIGEIRSGSTNSLYVIIGVLIAVMTVIVVLLAFFLRSKFSFAKQKQVIGGLQELESTMSTESQLNLVENEQIQPRKSMVNMREYLKNERKNLTVANDNQSKDVAYEMCQMENDSKPKKDTVLENHYAIAGSPLNNTENKIDNKSIINNEAIYNRISTSSDIYASNRSSASHEYKILEPEGLPNTISGNHDNTGNHFEDKQYAGLLQPFNNSPYAKLTNPVDLSSVNETSNDVQYAPLDGSSSPPKYASLNKTHVGNHSTGLAHSDDYVFM